MFYLTRLKFIRLTSLFTELFRSLISAPTSSLQAPDHVSQNHDVGSSLHLTEKTSDHTLTHSLSYLRTIVINSPTSELVSLLSNLHHVPRLSELHLCNVDMGNQECQLLASALKYVGKLRMLRLSPNPLGQGIRELAKHLHSVPHLKELHLNATQMGEEEVTTLAHSLQNVTQLSELELSFNPLGHGISELAKHLPNVPHLKKLYLRDTQMGEEEVTALARTLVYLPELKYLKLDKNPLVRGVSELIDYVSSSSRLRGLSLWKVRLTKKEATELFTLADERRIHLESDYHVSFPFVGISARNTHELPGRRKGAVF